MLIRSVYESVETFILKLEEDWAVPPSHIVRVDLYRLHLQAARAVLKMELQRWVGEGFPAERMRPSDLTERAADAVCESLKRASWCAFIPESGANDFASSGVISAAEPTLAESGIISAVPEAAHSDAQIRARMGRS